MNSLFVAELAKEGANVRRQQELIITHWRDYLQDCEGEVLHELSVILFGTYIPLFFVSPTPFFQS